MSRRLIRPAGTDVDPRQFVNLFDDFHGGNVTNGDTANLGDIGWVDLDISGSGGSTLNTTATAPTAAAPAFGARRIRGGASNVDGAYALARQGGSETLVAGSMGPGSRVSIRFAASENTTINVFAGVISRKTAVPIAADASRFFGLRLEIATDANVYGVVKNGAATETIQAIAAVSTSAYTTYTIERLTATTFRVSGAGITPVTFTSANFPLATATMMPMIGIESTGSADREIDIDFFQIWAPLDRS